MIADSNYLLTAAGKGVAFLPMNFWGIELFRFATLLANLSRTRALSLPISALMCLASVLAGLGKCKKKRGKKIGKWGRRTNKLEEKMSDIWYIIFCYRLLLLRFLPGGPAVVREDSNRAHSNLAVLMLRWKSPAHPQTVPSLARGSIK